MDSTEISINGKTLPVFTERNLESMSREVLKNRGLDLKDLMLSMGAVNVSVPRHPEPLRKWILATQETLLSMGPPGGGGIPAGHGHEEKDHGHGHVALGTVTL